ncbi:MAG TPA: DUF928 domain-containing protein [Leptolyngbyaceae cyanobacterium M33_DOE_097]|nr:DUF928 domain-containing protein [Leptolyngbyaceae cyanobacterium M33_DOE_097]
MQEFDPSVSPFKTKQLGKTNGAGGAKGRDDQLQPLIFNTPKVPGGTGRPSGNSSSSGGASRGDCTPNKELIALVPVYRSGQSQNVWGLTIAEHPSFGFYVPEKLPLTATLTLAEDDKKLVYSTKMILPGESGIIHVSLPSTAPKLALNQAYRWYFKIDCGPYSLPKTVSGWIQRTEISATLKQQLTNASLAERVRILAQNGIWYDALTGAAELRRTNPADRAWQDLLKAIALENLANEPQVDCCQLAD